MSCGARHATAGGDPAGAAGQGTGPRDVELLPFMVADQTPAGTFVGSLSCVADQGATVTFSLVDGCGGAPNNNAYFSLSGFDLSTCRVLHHDETPTLNICVRATESGTPPIHLDTLLTVSVLPPDAHTRTADQS